MTELLLSCTCFSLLALFFLFLKATGKAVVEETSKLAECIGKTRTLLRKILSEGVDHCMVKLDNDPQRVPEPALESSGGCSSGVP